MLVVGNVGVPLLVLLLVGVVGVVIAAHLKHHRVHKVMLASYPLLFHLCFVVFRMTTHNQVLVYAQIASLAVLLVGSIHHTLFVVFISGSRLVAACRNNNAVTPKKSHLMAARV